MQISMSVQVIPVIQTVTVSTLMEVLCASAVMDSLEMAFPAMVSTELQHAVL